MTATDDELIPAGDPPSFEERIAEGKKVIRPKTRYSKADEPSADIVAGIRLRDLFEDRLRCDGRLELYKERIKILVSQGVEREKATAKAGKEFGRHGLDKERKLYRLRMSERVVLERKREERAVQAVDNAVKMKSEYVKAFESLPDTADPLVELDWIRSHPAMTRMARGEIPPEDEDRVKVTTADILRSPNGRAPSKGAVTQLQYWCNRPGDFFKGLLSEQKKGAAAGGKEKSADEEAEDADLAELDALLGL